MKALSGLNCSEHDAFVRCAKEKDVPMVKQLADRNRDALGFVLRSTLVDRLHHNSLLIYECSGRIVGFISFRHRRDGWTIVYDLCVEKAFRKKGIGRALMKAVEDAAAQKGQIGVRLKCPVNLSANGFYSHLGFSRIAVEKGKRRPLAVWEKAFPLVMQKHPTTIFSFFITLTNHAKAVRDVVRLWDNSEDKRNPFKRVIFTPLFSKRATVSVIRELKEKRGSEVMFDSGGYQVQMGKARYEELFDLLLRFYQENSWADWYVLPDHVPRSTDSDKEVELKVRETIDFAKLFLRKMPKEFARKALGVVHGRKEDQVRQCMEAYAGMGLNHVGFGSFGTSGPRGTVNLVSQRSLSLLQLVQSLANEYDLRLHIFGIGSPNHLLRLARAGITPASFDSAGWWKAGAFGKVFFPTGRQLHITRGNGYATTRQGIQLEKERTNHDCSFCADIFELRRQRMMRIMHNLAAMMDTVERISKL